MGTRLAKKVLLIGWDAAEWNVINPMIEQGLMPTLEALIKKGVSGRIATLNPPLSPMLWTSIATGMRADKHGILGFIEPDKESGGVRQVRSTSRKVKALWNILTQSGMKSNVIGWWPSHPVEPINGMMVSNIFHHTNDFPYEAWPVIKHGVHPPELVDEFANLRVHPHELTEAHVLPFIPNAASIDQENELSIKHLTKFLADASSIQAFGTWALENTEWDLSAVYFDAIDHFCHTFMKYHPPRMKAMPEEFYELYKDVLTGAYRFHDMMLERLLQLAGEDCTVILLSDHGFHTGDRRLEKFPNDPMFPAFEHSPYGVFCIAGPGIQKNEKVFGATLLDIAPTVLTLLGLPVGQDMDGKVLTQVFDKEVIPEYIESWEKVEGQDGRHAEELQQDPWEEAEAMKQLVELGYVQAPDDDKQKALDVCEAESKYNLALTFLSGRKVDKAIPLLEELNNKYPDKIKYALNLGNCYLALENVSKARELLNKIKVTFQKEIPSFYMLEGKILLEEKRFIQALESFKKVEEMYPSATALYLELGKNYLGLRRYEDARKAFLKALDMQGDHPFAHHGLGIVYKKTGLLEEAVEELLKAIDLLYYYPAAHYHLAETLALMEDYEHALAAFKVTVKLAPGMKRAHQWLVKIYEEQYNDSEKANEHRKFMRENIKEKITIVSGLPRSGTSMMMQMLDQGGMAVLADDKRLADENNPKGYFEFEPVKRLMQDNKWIGEAQGKAVKVIAQLLTSLPPAYEYKVVFMQRDMDQVLRSQQVMLKKEDEIKKNIYPAVIANAFAKQLQQLESWLQTQPHIEVLNVNYQDVIENPEEQAKQIADFLEQELDIEKMISAVDPSLHRNNKKVWA